MKMLMQALPTALGCVGLMISCATGAAATSDKLCYPATANHPLESELVVDTNGGAFTAALEKAFFTPFMNECGVKVISEKTPNRTFAQMIEYVRSGNVAFDVGDTFVQQEFPLGIQEGIFLKLPDGFWDPIKKNMVAGSYSDYGAWSAPYSTVMIFSTKAFPEGLHSWADFWDVKKYPGPRTLQNDPSNIVFALLATGMKPSQIYPITPDKIKLAFQKLDEVRPYIRTYWKAGDQPVQGVGNGEFVAGSAWSGRAYTGVKQGFPIGVSWQGNLLNLNWFFILKGSKHPRAAEALLYFIQDPKRQADFANIINYSGGRKEVVQYISPEIAEALPTSPQHVAEASVINGDWWAANQTAVAEAWNTWLTTGKQ